MSACLGLSYGDGLRHAVHARRLHPAYLFVLTLLQPALVHLSLLFPAPLQFQHHPGLAIVPYLASAA